MPDGHALAPNTVKALLAVVKGRSVTPTIVKVGLRVCDTWRFPDGSGVCVEYVVHGGETMGFLTDNVSGEKLRHAHICRSLHVTARTDQCVACGEATGDDGVRPCGVCGAGTCRRCGATDTHCGACVRLRGVGTLGRLFGGVGRNDEAWTGKHAGVEVMVRRVGNKWSVERRSRGGRQVADLSGERLAQIRTLLPNEP